MAPAGDQVVRIDSLRVGVPKEERISIPAGSDDEGQATWEAGETVEARNIEWRRSDRGATEGGRNKVAKQAP